MTKSVTRRDLQALSLNGQGGKQDQSSLKWYCHYHHQQKVVDDVRVPAVVCQRSEMQKAAILAQLQEHVDH